MQRLLSAAATTVAVALGATAIAQTPNNLIGLTRATPLVLQRDHAACANLPPCAPAGFPAVLGPAYAGGTAWDPQRNAVWISNGQAMAFVNPDTCAYLCPPFPAPLMSGNAFVTGLENVESLNQVWMLDSFGNLYQCTYSCPPVPISVCNTGLPLTATNATGGLAVDECNRLVFYTYSDWTTGATRLHVAPMATPCAWTQVFAVTGCGTTAIRPITGLGVDGCNEVLYLTDGVTTIAWSYTVAGGIVTMGPKTCCTLPPPAPGDMFVGLAVRSGRATSLGGPCANGACPPCPMVHTLLNSPNLGNANFALSLSGAPFNSLVWVNIGAGPCGPGAVLPPLCGPLWTGPSLGTIGPIATPAGLGCGASVVFPLGLPVIPGLCGAVLSSQCLAICGGTPMGTSLSNCLSWELQSN